MLESKKKCCGCGYCSTICPKSAIQMLFDEKGFLYPTIRKDLCINCGLCIKKCAMLNDYKSPNNPIEFLALKSKSKEVLRTSSSGGAFFTLASFFIKEGGFVYGAVFDSQSKTVRHVKACTIDDLSLMQGSKYVQSETTSVFRDVKETLARGVKVLFVGTPCQVAQLLFVVGKNNKNLFLVDLFCHGVPSPLLFKEHLLYWEGKKKTKIIDYKFRSKKYGYEHNHVAVFENGKTCSSIELKRILKLFDYSMRESCYCCPYTSKQRFGDITIGDLWESYFLVNDFKHNGSSSVIINTDKGKDLFIKIANNCSVIKLDDTDIKQDCLFKPVQWKSINQSFWNDYLIYGYKYVLDKYGRSTLKSTIYQSLLRFLFFTKLDSVYLRIKRKLKKQK